MRRERSRFRASPSSESLNRHIAASGRGHAGSCRTLWFPVVPQSRLLWFDLGPALTA